MRHALKTFFLLVCVATSSLALAESTMQTSRNDSRIRFIRYNPLDVVKIVGHYGYSTHLQFEQGESIQHIAAGDSEAWDFAPTDNHLFIKPRLEAANTNISVLTNKRVYQFFLDAHVSRSEDKAKDIVAFIIFVYPETKTSEPAIDLQARNDAQVRSLLDRKPNRANTLYKIKGNKDNRPSDVFDDGRFTYFKFPAGTKMPAVYAQNKQGDLMMVNFHVDGDLYVVHELSSRFVLQIGNSKTTVINEGYGRFFQPNDSGTVSSGVIRATQGQ
jgi:type IV secretion system protein VirB9